MQLFLPRSRIAGSRQDSNAALRSRARSGAGSSLTKLKKRTHSLHGIVAPGIKNQDLRGAIHKA